MKSWLTTASYSSGMRQYLHTRIGRKSLISADCRPIRPRFTPSLADESKRPCMAGHSQFKNIMHRKGKQDAQKSKLFGKLAREITVAAKLGTPDPAMNPRLRAAVIAARQENMPKDNIERAIKKATGVSSESGHEIYASQETFREVAKALESKFGEARKAALTWKPQNTIAVDDETGEKLLKLMDLLNEHDDVQNVYANFEISDALMAKMGG